MDNLLKSEEDFTNNAAGFNPNFQGSDSDDKHCENNPRCLRNGDFKETFKYQNFDKRVSQRHFIGNDPFNNDDIKDLSPHNHQKVLNVMQNMVFYFSSKYPEDFDESKNPEIKSILDLNQPLECTNTGCELSHMPMKSSHFDDMHKIIEKDNLRKELKEQNIFLDKCNISHILQQSVITSTNCFKNNDTVHIGKDKNTSLLASRNSKCNQNLHKNCEILHVDQSANMQSYSVDKKSNLTEKYLNTNNIALNSPKEKSQNKRNEITVIETTEEIIDENSKTLPGIIFSDYDKSQNEILHCDSIKKEITVPNMSEVEAVAILESENTIRTKHYYVPLKNIKKTKEYGFFILINVSENNVTFWLEFLQNVLKHKDFILETCCQFSESLVLNFEKKFDAIKAIRVLRNLKKATKNHREAHILFVSKLKTHIVRPCECSRIIFENCKKYFEDLKRRFVKEHKNKISEVKNEMEALHNMKDKKMRSELKMSLIEKLDILEKMMFVYLYFVEKLEKKLSLHKKLAVEGNLSLKEKFFLQDEQILKISNQEYLALKELLILEKKLDEGKISIEEKKSMENTLNSNVEFPSYSVYFAICQLKKFFVFECNSLQRCLPVYSKKDELLRSVQKYPVLIINAETGSGKTTQLAEYLLQSRIADMGSIICTQPRKVAAISVTKFVCAQIGSAVGKLVGYDVGTDKKYDNDTKIIYMTDYALLKKLIQNKTLQGVSCIIIDEAHERTLYTDLVLGMLKSILNERLDLRLIVTSATMNNNLFIKYFGNKQTGIIDVPGRTYPVEIIWFDRDVEIGWNYVKECVETALMLHQEESEGDILVFLTSPGEIDEAIMMFRDSCQESEMPQLISLHGKSDLKEQLLVFESNSNNIRKIVFATNTAETSLTIPGIKYVIDSGMTKEMTYFPHKNKSCLAVSFINKSSAEQRKGRAGRTQPGVCYRLYSKRNFEENFPDSPTPEILKTNLQKALLKLYQFGIEPTEFDFVESPPREAIFKSLDSLEHLGLIQEKERTKKFCLTKLGKQVCDLPLEPRLAKFVIEGVHAEIGYETIIMAALVQEAGRLFFRTETIKEEAYRRKKVFCQKTGDLCTYLEVYRRWMEEAKDDRYNWCVQNFINSKALHSASRTIEEVLKSLYQELGIRISRRYNNNAFEYHYERVIFNCFSENLCVFSGHPKMGYYSLHFKESLFIHPASSLSYLKTDLPTFLVYGTLMETTRSFLMDVTPIKEETLQQAYQKGIFHLDVNMVKSLQIIPKVLGPFGQSVLVNHILGKRGSKIIDLELLVEKLVKSRNFKIDVQVDKGIILIYLEKRYHETVSSFINNMVDEAHIFMSNEEETIKIKNSSSYFCLGAGGLISDIIMPGEFKEVVIDNLSNFQSKSIKETLKSFGSLQSLHVVDKGTNFYKISVTYVKVASAQKAMLYLSQQKGLKLKAIVYVPDENEVVPLYKMEVSWCRHFAVGKGWIEFYCEADCILASGKLNLKPFYLNENYIQFTPSYSSKILNINNLPSVIEENTIKEKLQKVLPDVKIRQIYIMRKKMPPVSEKDIEHVRKELKKLFSQSSLIDLKYPNPESIFWKALVYFKNWQNGAKAYSDLEDCAKIDSVPVQIRVIKESHLQCKKDVYAVIEEEIHFIKNKYLKDAKFSIFLSHGDTLIDIRFSCKNMPTLFDIHLELSQLLQGEIINCFEPKYHHLLTSAASCKIQKIEQRTKTAIIVDKIRKLISVFGVKKNRIKASMEVRSIVFENCRSKKRRFDVKDPNIPHGFLKNIYSKYGLKLNGLISAFCLKNAEVDSVSGKLVVEGTQSNLDKLEEHLENICNELYKKNLDMNNDEDADTCPICFDSLIYGFSFRLENCGHAFCETCLILQIESRTIPLICVKQNCGKKFFVSDIKKLLNKCTENTRKDFYAVSLNYFINQCSSQVFYCPSPDCHNVFRVSSTGEEQFCFGCGNVICTRCKSLYHYGMSCEIYQNIEKDEDYSVKLWMQKDKALRKQCSYCQAVIEKVSGCNNMECYNCHKHLCWLCLKIFLTSHDVYDHLPYCSGNQHA